MKMNRKRLEQLYFDYVDDTRVHRIGRDEESK